MKNISRIFKDFLKAIGMTKEELKKFVKGYGTFKGLS